MKRTVIVAAALLVLGLILGPVIVRQLSRENEGQLQGPQLSELEYSEVLSPIRISVWQGCFLFRMATVLFRPWWSSTDPALARVTTPGTSRW